MLKITISLLFTLQVYAVGNLYIVGGGKHPNKLAKSFIQLCGDASKLLIISKASSQESSVAKNTRDWFLSLGAKDVRAYSCSQNADSCLTQLNDISCIYFSGGDQKKLFSYFNNTKAFKKIKEIYKQGGSIGGTSAGAAIMSEIMLTGELLDRSNGFNRIAQNHVQDSSGFGFLDRFIVDQHFIKRRRQNRLLSKVLEFPHLVGIGIDESTAVIFKNSQTDFIVAGEASVLVYDARQVKSLGTDRNGNYHSQGIKLTVLTSGQKFNL